MKCNYKVMLSVALAMLLGTGFAYLTFEDARVGILASLPILAALLCPISLLIMMKFMHSSGQSQARASQASEAASSERDSKPVSRELA
jgi:hypothetical protein